MTEEHRLRAWLARATPVALAGVVDDAHIDELDPRLRRRPGLWLAGVRRLFDAAAVAYARAGDTRCVLAAALSLRSGEDATGVNFASRAELDRELSYTPPSLYLLRRDVAAWLDSAHGFVVLSPRLKLCATPYAVVRYLEYREPEECEYRRSLWLTLPSYGSAAGDSC